uniref:Uncharacterized protein n=1 Tax=Chromera velia CCMP2878 TaxID=1169474 RepID=A0A0G4H8N3_9ALVE|eukprot:Cvel_25228.t1-p1 / transcript=Cvel_25228.t1 / gene=Cvel_25228 / organism=Chromera_velia_CCMP2878 / gene_product=hypothetical protein / transcript_product=hypothetical protein / location=Cvel_scaffold2829:6247-6558(-) / protein_length=104 / sequence_SO=supercontig / SO=protein_coding / is_pseudo=false
MHVIFLFNVTGPGCDAELTTGSVSGSVVIAGETVPAVGVQITEEGQIALALTVFDFQNGPTNIILEESNIPFDFTATVTFLDGKCALTETATLTANEWVNPKAG